MLQIYRDTSCWGTWIRTTVDGSKTRSPAAERCPRKEPGGRYGNHRVQVRLAQVQVIPEVAIIMKDSPYK
jgi:hypothetical protein